jgi:hypothetical protein
MTAEQVKINPSGNDVAISFAPSSPKVVIVTDGRGRELQRYPAGNRANAKLETKLINPLPNAAIFGIQVVGESQINYVAIPGKSRSDLKHGEGTLVDLARSLSDYYRLPVTLKTGSPSQTVSWTFDTTDPVSAASQVLGSNFTVTQLQSASMLEISESR